MQIQLLYLHFRSTLLVNNLVSTVHAYCRQVAQAGSIMSVVTMILSIHSSLGYVPQYPQNPSQFLPGHTYQPAYPHPGYPQPRYQYPPQQGYYYGQPAPTQLPPAGSLYHASISPQQHTPDPQMQGPSYQGNLSYWFPNLHTSNFTWGGMEIGLCSNALHSVLDTCDLKNVEGFLIYLLFPYS